MLKKLAQQIDEEYLDNPELVRPGIVLNAKALQANSDGSATDLPTKKTKGLARFLDGSVFRRSNVRGLPEEVYEVTKVFYRTPNYVIFEVNDSDTLEYITTDDVKYNTQAISLQLNRIEFWLIDSYVRKHPEGHFLETMADAIALCFEGKKDEALKTAVELETLVKTEVFKHSKMIYMFPYIILALLMVSIAALNHYFFHCHSLIWFCRDGTPRDPTFLLNLITFGVIGGLLSVSRHLNEYNVEIKYKQTFGHSLWEKFLVAVWLRFSISAMSPVVLYVFLKAELINNQILNPDKHMLMYSLAVIAGFSENLISSLVTKFEANLVTGQPIRVSSNAGTSKEGSTTSNTLPANTSGAGSAAQSGAANSTNSTSNNSTGQNTGGGNTDSSKPASGTDSGAKPSSGQGGSSQSNEDVGEQNPNGNN
jgi:hypothetical protein